jgi:hypothetical protein
MPMPMVVLRMALLPECANAVRQESAPVRAAAQTGRKKQASADYFLAPTCGTGFESATPAVAVLACSGT